MLVGFLLRLQFRRALPVTMRIFSSTKSISSASLSHLEPLYHWQEDVEHLEAYRSGGYHPIELGDELCQGRYRIVHKLGYGSFATVWLARDSTADRYVSLKVIAANASERGSEVEVLNTIHQNTFHHPGRRRGTLDIHLKNLAFKLPNLDSWPVEQVYEHIGSPNKQGITRKDGNPPGPVAPPYAVSPAILLKLGKPPTNEVSILDFGEASFTTELRKQWHTPILLQAPEALLGEPVGQSADIWAFACTVFAMFNNESLFKCFMPNADEVLSEVVDTLGRLPERWWEKWEHRGEFYEEDGRKKIEHLTEQYRETKPLPVRVKRMRSSPSLRGRLSSLVKRIRLGCENCWRDV
ncbi:MAG: hypothetical protein Q9163_006147 [Psora crenata]